MFVCPECGAAQPMPGHCGADGSLLADNADDLLIGTSVGAYRVARLLGVGGMGRVYKGVHPQIGSRVAIKVLSRECSDRRDLVERFFAEAKAVNLIRHESIVNVLDLAMLPDGRPYIVMEFLDGTPLSAIIEAAKHGGHLPLGGIARLAVEVLDALGAAHAKGIVHRDLKPDNIFVTPAGRAKVLDFGIAKLQPELGGSSTQSGSLLGTPHYMSSEQAAGRPVDHRADLYAMGVILFECATLQKPFTADSLFDLLKKHVEVPPPSPRAIRPDIPEGLEHVIFAALAKQPEMRFANAQAMSVALQHATAGLPPEQWAAVLPAYGPRPPSPGGWAPTPPASWARTGSTQRDHGATQTAGQVTTKAAPAKSKKGLWLLLGGVLAGVGVTVGVLVARSGGPSASPSAPAAGSAGSAVVVAGSGSAAGSQQDPQPKDPDDIDSIIGSMGGPMTPEKEAALDQEVNAIIAAVPNDQLPADLRQALKKYGTWSKIPAELRSKLLRELMAAGGMGGLVIGAGNDINTALAGGGDANRDPGRGADGWVVESPIPGPGSFDPKHVDVQNYLAYAIKDAKRLVPDAVLYRVDYMGVFPDGHADLTLVDNGLFDFHFHSASRAKRESKLPIGAKQEGNCGFIYIVSRDHGMNVTPEQGGCVDKDLGSPKCTVAQVWQKALAHKAPQNAIARMTLWVDHDGKATWGFTIDDPQAPFSIPIPDDCQ